MVARIELLKWIVTSAAANVSTQYPQGYVSCPVEQLAGINELAAESLVISYPNNGNGTHFPVVPTEAGVNASKQPAPLANVPQTQPAAAAPQSFTVKVEDNVPMPAAATRGFQAREGGSAVDRYGFDKLAIGQSFHLPPSNDPDKAKATHRVFSSTVSQANTKLHPKAFAVREVGADDPAGPGARVWRIADMTGPRPTRKPRNKPEAAPAAQPAAAAPQGWPAPGQAPGQGGGFAPQGGFVPPAGFAAPGAGFPAPGTSGGFGAPQGGFPENAPPAGFGANGPSFGG